MKRWILLPLLFVPLLLLLSHCYREKPQDAAQTIEQRFPTITPSPTAILPSPHVTAPPVVHYAPQKRVVHHAKPRVVKRVVKAPERLPQTEPEAAEAPVKPPCLFDFIAPCRAQEVGQ